jgi:DNA modification methylase
MKEAGWKEVPVQVVNWSEQQQKEFIIKDNVGFGEWEWDMLANEWEAEDLEKWGLDVPGFVEEPEAEEDDFAVPDGGIETDIVLGDLFEIGEHRLLCGDSTDSDAVAKLMDGQKCNLLTDPPYGIKANKQTLGTGKKQFHRGEDWDNEVPDFFYILELVDRSIIWGGNYFTNRLDVTNDWLCWHKKNDGLSFSEFEMAWTNLGKNCRMLSHHWGGEIKEHPTMKPLKVMEWCINFLDDKPILDLFLGSGSTMVASHQLKRKCYGMELDPKYCQVIVDRMLKLDPNLVIKRNGEAYVNTGAKQG